MMMQAFRNFLAKFRAKLHTVEAKVETEYVDLKEKAHSKASDFSDKVEAHKNEAVADVKVDAAKANLAAAEVEHSEAKAVKTEADSK